MPGSLDTAGTYKERIAKTIAQMKIWQSYHSDDGFLDNDNDDESHDSDSDYDNDNDGETYRSESKSHSYYLNLNLSCFGRLSLTNRDQSLALSPNSAQKLNSIIDLNPDLIPPEIIINHHTLYPTPTKKGPRILVSALTLQLAPNTTPIHVGIKTLAPSPYYRNRYGNTVELSPQTFHRATKVPAAPTNTKTYTARITLNDLIQAKNNPRTKSYQAFSGVSAQKLAAYEGTQCEDTRYEYLHLLAHAFGGKFERKNIVVGSWCANSQMMAYDNAAKQLLEQGFCQHIDISIQCTLEEKIDGTGSTHQAKDIQVTYKTDTGLIFSSPLINGDSIDRPTIEEHELIQSIIIACQKDSQTAAEQSPKQRVRPRPDDIEEDSHNPNLQTPIQQASKRHKANPGERYQYPNTTPLTSTKANCSFFDSPPTETEPSKYIPRALFPKL